MIDEARAMIEQLRTVAETIRKVPYTCHHCPEGYEQAANDIEALVERYEGWVMVPRRPDSGMLVVALSQYSKRKGERDSEFIKRVFDAMLAARPTPPGDR